MKKSRIFVAVLAAMAMGLAVFGCKSETNTEYVEKVYAEAVTFTAEDAGEEGVKVAMASKTEGAVIYYTIDESSESLKYSEPLTFSKDTKIKAFAVKEGIENSPISVASVSRTMGITKKIYVCTTCQKEFDTAKEAIDCCSENLDTTAPADVTELAAVAKDSSVLITWKDAADKDIYGYLVSWKTAGAGRAAALEKYSLIVAKGQQGCIVTGLANGTEYTFTVKTMDTSGNKSKGVPVNATPKAVPEGETLKINFAVPEEKSKTSVTITVIIETAAKDVKKVVYKKAGSLIASELLKDPGATEAVKDIADSKKWTFVLEATDESANGMYTVAAIDYDGREETARIPISNFDFTAPKLASELKAELSTGKTSVTLTWKDPVDEDFDHVEICFVSNDGTEDSEKSEAVEVKKGVQTKVFDKIDSNMAYYMYFIVTVDTLGNKSSGNSTKVYVAAVSKIPEGFEEIPAVLIAGTENWTPSSNVFISGRALKISSFYMSDHLVTRGEYKTLMGEDPSIAKAYDNGGNELTGDDNVKNHPVNYISWYALLVYCNTRSIDEGLDPCYKISGSTKPNDWGSVPTSNNDTWNAVICDFTANGYRLPTEAEWEWAARGGEKYTYAGSDDIDEVAWYKENTSGTREVRTKKANAYGLYDMSGNVWELCWDWYGSISSETASSGSSSGSYLCQRGGSWSSSADYARVANRYSISPYNRYYDCGFRLVRNAN